jgi:4-diphosphocytidyl-2-C-methyl-D-erythritol kinase
MIHGSDRADPIRSWSRGFAAAKVNLLLHVIGRRADGYHFVDSLVAFADVGDRLTASPSEALSLALAGPEATSLAEDGERNLVLRAARLLAEYAGLRAAAELCLEKNLPVASGLGGGSADAAATLRLLRHLWRLDVDDAALARLGEPLGADVPVCVHSRPAWVGGVGERIEFAERLPEAGILLANPRRKLPTAAVFTARRGGFGAPARRFAIPADAAGLARELAHHRNDLTAAAIALAPEISDMLACLAQLPGALTTRMSGSGASCFALFADREAAARAAAALAASRPGWWCAAGALVAARAV